MPSGQDKLNIHRPHGGNQLYAERKRAQTAEHRKYRPVTISSQLPCGRQANIDGVPDYLCGDALSKRQSFFVPASPDLITVLQSVSEKPQGRGAASSSRRIRIVIVHWPSPRVPLLGLDALHKEGAAC